MSEYLSKKAVLESIGEAYQTNLESPDQTDWDEGYRSALRFMKRTVQSGTFDAPEPDCRNRIMTDREKKIAEIREVLEKATPGSWKWVDVYKRIDFDEYNMGGFVNEEGKLICHFGNRIDYYPTEGEPPDYYDELLIANAPEWLRFLLDELEHLERERAAHNMHLENVISELER